jgi:nitrogen regulatory protein P-II 1
MKQVIAFIQPFRVEKVVEALHGVAGLSGATVTQVRGFGRGRGRHASVEALLGTVERARIDAMVPDALADEVVGIIRDTARTGNRGDGKVFVVPLERAVRISTGEEGEEAV